MHAINGEQNNQEGTLRCSKIVSICWTIENKNFSIDHNGKYVQ